MFWGLFACVAHHDTLPQAEALAEAGVSRWEPEGLFLGWMPAVWGFGLGRLAEADAEPRWLVYADAWMKEEVPAFVADDPRTFEDSDGMAAAAVASWVLRERPEAGLEPIVTAAHAYLDGAPRVSGALAHWGDDGGGLEVPGQAWVDTLFMAGGFWLAEFDRTGDPAHLDAFVGQYEAFSSLLRDPDDHLYRHAWDEASAATIPEEPVYWARGNAWALVSGAEALRRREDPALAALVAAHAEAVIGAQDTGGGWKTVMNDPDPTDARNRVETSGTALLAYGLFVAGEAGAVDRRAVRGPVAAAVATVTADIGVDGVLHGTSYGTNPGDYENYVGVGIGDDQMIGVGAVVALLAEVHGARAE